MSDTPKNAVQEAAAQPARQSRPWITMPFIVCLLAGICCLLWGSAFPCIKIGYRLFQIASGDTASQLFFAGLRFTIAGLLVLLFAFCQRILTAQNGNTTDTTAQTGYQAKVFDLFPHGITAWKHIFILSFVQTVSQYFFFYIGLANTSGVKASTIEGMNVFLSILVASLLFRQERLTIAKITGCAIGFIGVILVNLGGSGLDFSLRLTGEGFILLSTVSYAFSGTIMKQFSRQEDPVLLSGWQFLIGGLVLMAIGGSLGGYIHLHAPSQAAMLLYLAFISAGAYTLWSILLKYNPVSRVSVYGFMNPVFGVALSWLLLRDSSQTLGGQSVLALILVCAGIYIVNRR